MRNLGQILFVVNRDMGILKRLIKAQSNLINELLQMAVFECEDDAKLIDNLKKEIKNIADETKRKK